MQLLGTQKSETEKTTYFFKEICKVDPELFDQDKRMIALNRFYEELSKDDAGEPKDVNQYKLPRFPDGNLDLLSIRIKSFVEMLSAEVDAESFINAEIICACMYRKDHESEVTENEIIETAIYFRTQPFKYTVWAIKLMDDLVKLLREMYPILYSGKKEVEREDEVRQLDDMINGLAKDDVTKWGECEQLKLSRAFRYLERSKKDYLKKKNEGNM